MTRTSGARTRRAWAPWLGLVPCLLLLGLATASAAPAPKVWVVSPLPANEDWAGCFGNDVNDAGLIGGGWVDGDGAYHAAYWDEDGYHDLGDEVGYPDGFEAVSSVVLSINGHGLMGGSATDAQGFQVAVLWDVKHGTARNLSPSDDLLASALWGVNSSGDACGYTVYPIDDPPYFAVHPHVWPKGDDVGTDLPVGDHPEGFANGINASGVVTGMVGTRGGVWYACIWTRDGNGDWELVDLSADFDEDLGVVFNQGFDVAEDGTVVGYGYSAGLGMYFAWTWSAQHGVTLLDDGDRGESIAWKANGNYVAGGVGYYGWDESAAVWNKGVLEQLPGLEGLASMEASSVSAKGLVVGYGFAEDDPYLTTPQGWYAEKK